MTCLGLLILQEHLGEGWPLIGSLLALLWDQAAVPAGAPWMCPSRLPRLSQWAYCV